MQQLRAGSGTSNDLDVWFIRRVLSAWKPLIIRRTPGDRERHLIEAANVAA